MPCHTMDPDASATRYPSQTSTMPCHAMGFGRQVPVTDIYHATAHHTGWLTTIPPARITDSVLICNIVIGVSRKGCVTA